MYICTVEVLCSCEVKTRRGFVRANWRANVSGALVRLWRVQGRFRSGFIIDFANMSRTITLSLSGLESVSSCER